MEKIKAIAVYVDNSERILTEFSWLYKTWKLYSLDEEFDLVVYHHPLVKEKLEMFSGIIKIEMPNIRLSEKYKFLNSHYFCLDEWSEPLKKYKYLLKTDCDVFLTENLKGYIPSKFMIGEGGYYMYNETEKFNYIRELSKSMGLNHNNMSLIGASFFGKTNEVLFIVKKQAFLTESILENYSKTKEFQDSGFKVGISSMIAGEIIINHTLSNQYVILYTLDNKCWETTKIGSDVLHIHAWHSGLKWSKHSFFNGDYKDWIVEEKEVFKNAANYCHWIATLPFEKLEYYKEKYQNDKLNIDYGFNDYEKKEYFSVIIPTMWNSNRTEKLLKDLNECELIDEIVIIDNNPKHKIQLNNLEKIKIITTKENIYVNPAWNLGVKNSKNNLICLCNDDINFDVNDVFNFIHKNTENLGCIGVHPNSYKTKNELNKLSEGYHTGGGGWGCLIFCKKENWIEIPNNLKIGYGDDWIAITNKPHYSLTTKENIITEMSTTSSKKEFNLIVRSDIKIWKRIFS